MGSEEGWSESPSLTNGQVQAATHDVCNQTPQDCLQAEHSPLPLPHLINFTSSLCVISLANDPLQSVSYDTGLAEYSG
jgi:hypothetical protein